MKKIMFLGGSTQQIPAIEYAKNQGYYSILCDFIPDNPGQYYANEFYCVSTTDKDAILEIALKTSIDGIVAYASDPAAPTAAYVGNKMNLPSNPYESVQILSRKDLFRNFLTNNGFNTPLSASYTALDEAKADISRFEFPIIIKPTDSSGSKGITKVMDHNGFNLAFSCALDNSRNGIVIVEEFIEMAHEYMIGGDAFIVDGIVSFYGLLNCHRNVKINALIPIGKSYPLFLGKDKEQLIHNEIQKVITKLDMRQGALNVELMFGKNGKLYIIEIGPRNGGNMIPNLLEICTGIDLIGATVEAALGNSAIMLKFIKENVYYSTYVLHSGKNGKLENIVFNQELQGNVIKKVIYKESGSEIEVFNGSNKALGIVFLKYGSLEEMKYKMDNMDKYIEIEVV